MTRSLKVDKDFETEEVVDLEIEGHRCLYLDTLTLLKRSIITRGRQHVAFNILHTGEQKGNMLLSILITLILLQINKMAEVVGLCAIAVALSVKRPKRHNIGETYSSLQYVYRVPAEGLFPLYVQL